MSSNYLKICRWVRIWQLVLNPTQKFLSPGTRGWNESSKCAVKLKKLLLKDAGYVESQIKHENSFGFPLSSRRAEVAKHSLQMPSREVSISVFTFMHSCTFTHNENWKWNFRRWKRISLIVFHPQITSATTRRVKKRGICECRVDGGGYGLKYTWGLICGDFFVPKMF